MAETPENNRDQTDLRDAGEPMRASELEEWFVKEVLPLEAALMQFLRYNWRNQADIADLLQEIYLKVYQAAQVKRPDVTRPFVFATARNTLLNHIHRSKIVPIEAVTDLESLPVATDEPPADQAVIARDELRRVQNALEKLSPRSHFRKRSFLCNLSQQYPEEHRCVACDRVRISRARPRKPWCPTVHKRRDVDLPPVPMS